MARPARGPKYRAGKDTVTGIRGTPNGRNRDRHGDLLNTFETFCSACGGLVYAYGGGSLWCAWCLGRIAPAGRAFDPVITTRMRHG